MYERGLTSQAWYPTFSTLSPGVWRGISIIWECSSCVGVTRSVVPPLTYRSLCVGPGRRTTSADEGA